MKIREKRLQFLPVVLTYFQNDTLQNKFQKHKPAKEKKSLTLKEYLKSTNSNPII